MTVRRGWKVLAAMTALAVVAAGCGDDDDEGAETASGDGEAYCELAAELDAQEDFPSEEQLLALQEAAPAEIDAEIDIVVAAFLEAMEAGDVFAAFEDPAVEEAFEPIEAYEGGECGIEQADEEDQDPSVTELDPAATRVDVSATDYAFTFSPPAAGRTSFVMTNEGEERHVMLLARLADGATLEEVLASQGDDGVEEEFESDTAAAGEEAVLTADLTPGDWAMICYIADADGTSHYDLGMQQEFTVQ